MQFLCAASQQVAQYITSSYMCVQSIDSLGQLDYGDSYHLKQNEHTINFAAVAAAVACSGVKPQDFQHDGGANAALSAVSHITGVPADQITATYTPTGTTTTSSPSSGRRKILQVCKLFGFSFLRDGGRVDQPVVGILG